MDFKELSVVPFYGWTEYTPVIPKMYWDVYSQEERIKLLLKDHDKLVHYASYLAEQIQKNNDNQSSLEEQFQKFIEGKFDEYYAKAAADWVEKNMPKYVEAAMKNVYFGVNEDGHMIAYVPENWNELIFDTGYCYGNADYGRLILRWDVDGEQNVNQQTEINNYGIERYRECDTATDIDGKNIEDGTITSAKIADNAVDSGKIADGTVTNADLSAAVNASLALADSSLQSVWSPAVQTPTIVGGNDITSVSDISTWDKPDGTHVLRSGVFNVNFSTAHTQRANETLLTGLNLSAGDVYSVLVNNGRLIETTLKVSPTGVSISFSTDVSFNEGINIITVMENKEDF